MRSDKSELNWVALKYEGKSKIIVGGKGSGGYVHARVRPSCSVECPRELTLTPCSRARHTLSPLKPVEERAVAEHQGASPTPLAAARAHIGPPTAGRRVLPGSRVHARRAAAFRGDGHARLMVAPSPSFLPLSARRLLLACAWRCEWRCAGLQSSRPMYPPTSARGICFWKKKDFVTKILGHRERVSARWQGLTLLHQI